MRSPIRITGLVIFLIISGLFFATLAIAINPVVNQVIETAGSEAIGAKVELESVDVSITEQRLALEKLAVTDPRAPMFNLFEVAELTMDVDADALLWNKIVVDELKIIDLYLNTPRSESGEYEQRWLDKSAWNPMSNVGGFEQLSLDNLPSAEAVVEQESLQTPAAVEAFKVNLANTKEDLSRKIAALPDEAKIQDYEKRFKDIKEKSKGGNKLLGLLTQGKELKALQDDVKAEIAKVKALKNDLKTAQNVISADLKTLKQMPAQDWQRLKAKYSLSGNGVNEIVSSLFGEQIGSWAQKGWHYYQMVSPYLNSYNSTDNDSEVKVSPHITDRGRKVLFEDQNPLPNYLLKKVQLSSQLQDYGLALSGLIENLTTEPYKWSEPMTLDLSGQSSLMKAFNLKGLFDHRNNDSSRDTISLEATALQLGNLAVESSDSPYTINEGLVDISADIQRSGGTLDGTLTLNFSQLAVASTGQENWQSQLIQGVNQLQSLAVVIELSGDINAPDITINSPDLSAIGQAVIREMASDKISEFESELQAAITEKTAGMLSDVEGLADLTALQERLNVSELNLEDLLKINR